MKEAQEQQDEAEETAAARARARLEEWREIDRCRGAWHLLNPTCLKLCCTPCAPKSACKLSVLVCVESCLRHGHPAPIPDRDLQEPAAAAGTAQGSA